MRRTSESTHDDEWGKPWKIVSVAASDMDSNDSPWAEERLKQDICHICECKDDFYVVAIDRIYLSGLRQRGCQMTEYDPPVQSSAGERNVYGTRRADKKVEDAWLQHAAATICREQRLEVKLAYLELAQSISLRARLQERIDVTE